jgi:hypothetical protein
MPNTFTGDADNNYIVSANGDDIIYGLDGVDELYGRGGIDQLFGGNGEDTLYGEDGTDTLDGGADNDKLDGGYGDDTLTGGGGLDTFFVNDEHDTITDLGAGGADVLQVGAGARVDATIVADWAAAPHEYSDSIYQYTDFTTNDGIANLTTAGFSVDLSLAAGSAGFTVTNTGDATTLIGSAQDDTLHSGTGADLLIGGGGNDTFTNDTRTATVVYDGNQADYTVTKIAARTWQVVDANLEDGDSGTDTLVGIPQIQFADGTVDLPVNRAPVVADGIANQSISEDSPFNFQVPAGAFSDPDSDTLTLTATLADGSPLPSWLTFDLETKSFVGTPPQDFNGQIAFTVTASDGEFSVSDNFTLTVTAVNDAPVITSGDGGTEANYTVLENSRTVATVTATDPDVGAYQRFAIVGGADASRFQISSRTGALTFRAGQDYEDPSDADHNGVYDVVVRVSDGRLSDTQTLHVTLADVTDELLTGSLSDNTLVGADGRDRLSGYSGNDTLDGGGGDDRLFGGTGTDTLLGGSGNDRLVGGDGVDALSGGIGRDVFVFDVSPAAGGVDIITDFNHAQGDKIMLSMADFNGFTQRGYIAADQFYAADGATTAQDASDRIIYNTANGAVYYDADGIGGTDAVQIATIESFASTKFGYYDFIIVA